MTITYQLLEAYRVSAPARRDLVLIPWKELPDLLAALGMPLTPESAAIVATGIHETDSRGAIDNRAVLAIRGILALTGDRALAASDHGGRCHTNLLAIVAMCRELVNLTGAALALRDAAERNACIL